MNKNNKNPFLIFLSFLFLLSGFLYGETGGMSGRIYDKALLAYAKRDFERAVKLAESISSADSDYGKSRLLLADVYHELDSLAAELRSLEQAASVVTIPLVQYRLGECYYKAGAYEKGLTALMKYSATATDRNLLTKAARLAGSCRFSAEAIKNPVAFQPQNLGNNVNSRWDDYWPSLTVDGKTLVFTRLVPVIGKPSLKQEDFYESNFDSAGWQPAFPLSELNTSDNEGAQSISADGTLLFYTLCNHPEGMGSCDIFFSRFVHGSWSKPRNAGPVINTAGWEGQPSFSAFGGMLYFSSGREGGKGGKDIWQSRLTGWGKDGTPLWSPVTNCGDSINTPGNEISPFIHPNGRDLYFSSDFRPGLGGYDIFHSHQTTQGTWSEATNLGYPVNSGGNEQGLIIDRTGEKAYFSSNREPSGNMDIFFFALDKRIRPEAVTYLRGEVLDRNTGNPVQSTVQLSWRDAGKYAKQDVTTGEQGIFLVVLPFRDSLSLTVNKNGFLFYNENFMLSDSSSVLRPVTRKIYLVPLAKGSSVDIYNIFFGSDAYKLLPASLPALENLLTLLQDNPDLQIEIQGHTDNTGSRDHNLQLSEKRAGEVVQFLIGKGIPASRISSRGYGFDKPVASNDTGEGRSKNRRTTILVIDN